ncbi:TPA: molecular chaperone [Citrobacter braakii]|uniref:fimbrial biogenesis chaperone n=1 Tax=unclassified Citrobacter TaxID=2644389 RepID=UPI0005EE74B5|nr:MULTISPECIES: molecular chaperone [Citrobacter]MBJ9595865.1 molecular chaperone [Citrobacter werkmanii]MBJ9871282.1 molecular chaperone [Citrobacter werkmanii]MDM2943628.1 molecular chaperone [Citrobacter sp. Cm038]HEB0852176.1 molecular chaperone [Citrobacter freundii]
MTILIRIITVVITLLCNTLVSQAQAGGVVLQRTRVIYNADRKEAALPLLNHSDKMPYLLQSWVDNLQDGERGPFIITPPLFRLDAGDSSSLRIIKTDASLPDDKESMFYINVRAIPAQNKSTADKNMLTLVFKTRIKLFYRPAQLKGRAVDAWKTVVFKRSGNSLNIYNPSEYYVVFAGMNVGKTELTQSIDYLAPGENKTLPLPANTGNTVKWAAINDYGGSTEPETRQLQ